MDDLSTPNRTHHTTRRELDFFSVKELTAQTGHDVLEWPLVALKELVDNALDACEEAGVAPEINVTVDADGIEISDNGPGIDADVVKGVCDFSVRVSSREAYVAVDRGAQGNALKTMVAMPLVLTGQKGRVDITSCGVRHEIGVTVDQIQQKPVITRGEIPVGETVGATVRLWWPNSDAAAVAASEPGDLENGFAPGTNSACLILRAAEPRFLQFLANYACLNPHASFSWNWHGSQGSIPATDPTWRKWSSRDRTSAHWYTAESLARLIVGYVGHDQRGGRDRLVREFVAEFHGLSGSSKQSAVLDATGLSRCALASLINEGAADLPQVEALLAAMKAHSKPVSARSLGVIGKGHIAAKVEELGGEMDSFKYKLLHGDIDGRPWVVEAAFVWTRGQERRIITGVNFSPAIGNPFRELGRFGPSLEELLAEQWISDDDEVTVLLHVVHPGIQYTDRGKSAVVTP